MKVLTCGGPRWSHCYLQSLKCYLLLPLWYVQQSHIAAPFFYAMFARKPHFNSGDASTFLSSPQKLTINGSMLIHASSLCLHRSLSIHFGMRPKSRDLSAFFMQIEFLASTRLHRRFHLFNRRLQFRRLHFKGFDICISAITAPNRASNRRTEGLPHGYLRDANKWLAFSSKLEMRLLWATYPFAFLFIVRTTETALTDG